MTPQVSIIIATYNRSNVLRFAIESVLRQSLEAWELIVVGDACTDDTEAVVASFGDPRIRFFNLAENFGEQSKPNNVGIGLAQAPYLAFLNHDDVWLEDHLAHALAHLEKTGADLVYTLGSGLLPSGECRLVGYGAANSYSPAILVPASLWVFRRSLAEAVGPWRSAREIVQIPSQDFLLRAWRAGHAMVHLPQLTAVLVPSAPRRQAYALREVAPHAALDEKMRLPNFRERELAALLSEYARLYHHPTVRRALRDVLRALFLSGCRRWNLSPIGIFFHLRYLRKGGAVNRFRLRRGLSPLFDAGKGPQ